MSEKSLEKGLIQVYTGNGKGKTTAAFGLALRAVGAGLKVHMVQFMKKGTYSEFHAIKYLPQFTIVQFGRDTFVDKENPDEIDVQLAQEGLHHAAEVIKTGEYDVVILDELNVALDYNLVSIDDVLQMLNEKPSHVEIILTGRYAPSALEDKADLVTRMNEVKHPYEKGQAARRGIDY